MKVTIAQLQDRIKSLEKDKDNWYEKYRELKDADDKRNQFKMGIMEEERRQTDRQVSNLLEIIRWQINPETTKSPFMPTKTERDDSRPNY